MALDAQNQDFYPEIKVNIDSELFVGTVTADQNDGTIYTDKPGAFSVTSYCGNKCILVACEYCSDAIIIQSTKSMTDPTMVEVFQKVYEYFMTRVVNKHLT